MYSPSAKFSLTVPPGAFPDNTEVKVDTDSSSYDVPQGDYIFYRQVGKAIVITFSQEPLLPCEASVTFSYLEPGDYVVCSLVDLSWQEHAVPSIDGTTVSFPISSSGTYGIFRNDFKLYENASACFSKWPSWSAIRKNQASTGAKLLNIPLLETDRLKAKASEQIGFFFLETIPAEITDIVYRAELPPQIKPGFQLEFLSEDGSPLIEVKSPAELSSAVGLDSVYVDYERRLAYFSREHESISLSGKLEEPEWEVILPSIKLKPKLHHVWNMFDEFGLLLGTPRLCEERNAQYRDRLFAAKHYPAGPHRQGLVFGAARLLGLIKTVVWTDDSLEFVIPERVVEGTVRVDWKRVEGVQYLSDSCIIGPLYEGIAHKIIYIPDVISVHTLGDPNDAGLRKLLINPDGTPTEYHRSLAEQINRAAPIMWDYFRFDEAFWDVVDKQFTGTGCVPGIYDADIEGWRGYRV